MNRNYFLSAAIQFCLKLVVLDLATPGSLAFDGVEPEIALNTELERELIMDWDGTPFYGVARLNGNPFTGLAFKRSDTIFSYVPYANGFENGIERGWISPVAAEAWSFHYWETEYKEGRKHGVEKKFLRTGEMVSYSEWKRGFGHGAVVEYFANGSTKSRVRMVAGLNHGVGEVFDKEGKRKSFGKWINGINVKYVAHMGGGDFESPHEVYVAPPEITWFLGEGASNPRNCRQDKEGRLLLLESNRERAANGVVSVQNVLGWAEFFFIDGRREGIQLLRANFEGPVLQRFTCRGGVRHGRFEGYYVTGGLWMKGRCEDDVPVGDWEFYAEDGRLEREVEYRGGKKIKTVDYNKDLFEGRWIEKQMERALKER